MVHVFQPLAGLVLIKHFSIPETRIYGNKPDIENFRKLIVDAFRGILYPDDYLDYVRGVQVEGTWVSRSQHRTEIWIWVGQAARQVRA